MNSIIKCIPQRFTIDKMRLHVIAEFQFDAGIDAVSFQTTSLEESIVIKYKLIDPGILNPKGTYYKIKAETLHLPWDDASFPLPTHLVTVELYEFDGFTKINDDSMLTREGPVL